MIMDDDFWTRMGKEYPSAWLYFSSWLTAWDSEDKYTEFPPDAVQFGIFCEFLQQTRVLPHVVSVGIMNFSQSIEGYLKKIEAIV
jgi:hypothetical protein